MAEFSDLPMTRPAKTLYDLYEAKYVAEYLETYVDEFRYEGKSLRDRMIFGFTVTNMEKNNGNWEVNGGYNDTQEKIVFRTPKLMIASGLTSRPNMPSFPSQAKFKGSIIHQKDFGASSVLDSVEKHVTVLGGAKSAADMVYASVKAGKSVSWVIRRSGSGPAAFVGSSGTGPYKNSAELGFTRVMSCFTPSYYTPQNKFTKFLHATGLGNSIVTQFWRTADKVSRDGANFDKRPKALDSFKKLKPDTMYVIIHVVCSTQTVELTIDSIFWSNDALGLIQHPDFWQTVAENVQIYREDILELDTNVVRLNDGTEVPTDVLLCGTGWSSGSPPFFSREQVARLGLPHPVDQPTEDDPKWAELESEADPKVVAQFPRLAEPPDVYPKPVTRTAYRLYNCMASLQDDSILFLGHIHVANGFRAAECQAIWATAYFDKQVRLPSLVEMEKEVALLTAWCRRRYLNNGQAGNYLHYDLIGYTDKLLGQLGLSCHRKGMWDNLFSPCTAADFKPVKEKYLERMRGKYEV
jgi:hypothetical protein